MSLPLSVLVDALRQYVKSANRRRVIVAKVLYVTNDITIGILDSESMRDHVLRECVDACASILRLNNAHGREIELSPPFRYSVYRSYQIDRALRIAKLVYECVKSRYPGIVFQYKLYPQMEPMLIEVWFCEDLRLYIAVAPYIETREEMRDTLRRLRR